MNVITRSGTNELSGSSVLFLRDDRMAARLPRSPLDAARGVPADDARYEVDEFRRYNWGASLGGPIRRDRTHFFVSYDQTAQNQPFVRDIRGRGQYDAVRAAFPELVAGYLPNDDGIAAADPERGVQFQAHYTRSRDRSNDDNERSGSLTLTDPTDPDYDWGLSIRDVPHRFVASGVFTLPLDITASGIFTAQSGSPYTALDPAVGFHNHPGFAVGPHGAQARAVVDGALAPVNGERNASWTSLDLRPRGSSPSARFCWSDSDSRPARSPNSAGMRPVSPRFPLTSSRRRSDSVPNSGGSDPNSPLPMNSRAASSHPTET